MTTKQLPFDGDDTPDIYDTAMLPPFAAHVFFKVDGALDFDRDRFIDQDEAIEWACSHLGLMTSPVSAIVCEQSATQDERGTYPLTKCFELRVESEATE